MGRMKLFPAPQKPGVSGEQTRALPGSGQGALLIPSPVHAARVLLPLVLVAAFAPPAHAQPSPADQAVAAALFDDGRRLLSEGKVDEACAKLAQSYALEPVLGTLLNVAVCHDKQGKTATAWTEFNTAVDMATKAKEPARLKFATEQVKALSARLARLTVAAPGAGPSVSVRVDGRELGAAALGTAMPLDPGEHRVEVTAPGKRPFATSVKLDPGPSSRTVEATLVDADGAPPPVPPPEVTPPPVGPPPAPPPPVAPAPVPEQPTDGPRSTMRIGAGIAVGGAGLVGVILGAVYGMRVFQKKSDISSQHLCDAAGNCNDAGISAQQDAHRSAAISTVAFVVGGVAVAGGVVLIATSGSPAKPKAQAWVAPAARGVAAGVSW